MDDTLPIKLLVIGDTGVGKTSILSRTCSKKCGYNTGPSINYDFGIKNLKNFKGHDIRLQLWEIAGQEHGLVSRLYMRNAAGAIIITDVTESNCVKSALRWRDSILDNAELLDNGTFPMIMLQNKTDLIEPESKKKAMGEFENTRSRLLKEGFNECYQVSATSKDNLNEAIEYLVDQILGGESTVDTMRGDTLTKLDEEVASVEKSSPRIKSMEIHEERLDTDKSSEEKKSILATRNTIEKMDNLEYRTPIKKHKLSFEHETDIEILNKRYSVIRRSVGDTTAFSSGIGKSGSTLKTPKGKSAFKTREGCSCLC